MTISQMANQVRTRLKQGLPGELVYALTDSDQLLSLLNKASQTKQVDTVTIGTVSNSAVYAFSVNGVEVSYTSDASAVNTEIVAGLVAAVNAEPAVRGVVTAAAASATTLTLTSNWPGQSFEVTESDAKLSAATTTSNAQAAAVPYGLACIRTPVGADDTEQPGAVALDSLFTAQVVTVDYTYNGGSVLTVAIVDRHNSREIARASHTLATSKDASTTALANALNAQLPANTVLAANAGASGYELTLTAEVAGLEFGVVVYSDDLSTVAESVDYTTGPNISTSLLRAFTGVAKRRTDLEGEEYAANEGFVSILKGETWVKIASGTSITDGDAVYVELDDSGSLQGRLYNASSATRLRLPGLEWRRGPHSDNSSDLIAVVDVDVKAVRSFAG